jgi:CBS domain-containing protein
VNAIPVIEREGGKLVGMVSARDLLTALRARGD